MINNPERNFDSISHIFEAAIDDNLALIKSFKSKFGDEVFLAKNELGMNIALIAASYGSTTILDWIKTNKKEALFSNSNYSEDILDIAMKFNRFNSLEWLFLNLDLNILNKNQLKLEL